MSQNSTYGSHPLELVYDIIKVTSKYIYIYTFLTVLVVSTY